MRDTKKVLKNVAPLFSNNIKLKDGITLIENKNIISNDKNVPETFHGLFGNLVKTLGKNPGAFQAHPKLQSIDRSSKHPIYKTLRTKWVTQFGHFFHI